LRTARLSLVHHISQQSRETKGNETELPTEQFSRVVDGLDKRVDFVGRVIDVEGCPGRRGDAEFVVQRLGTVVAGPDSNGGVVEHLREVVGVDALDVERHQATTLFAGGRAVDLDIVELREPVECVLCEFVLVALDALHPDVVEVLDGLGECDPLRDWRRARLFESSKVTFLIIPPP